MERVPENITQSTVGITLKLKRTLHLVGTGVLIGVQGQSFVISAAHVIRGCGKYHGSIGILTSQGEFVTLEGGWICSGRERYGAMEDPLDVAVSPCDRHVTDKLEGNIFLGEDHMDISNENHGGVLSLFGYPVFLSENSGLAYGLTIKPVLVKTCEFLGNTQLVAGYRKELHLLLNGEAFSPRDFSWKGKERCPSSFYGYATGLSGCGVWRSEIQKGHPGGPYESERIVALQTGVYTRHKLIKATRWSAVMGFLRDSFSGLRLWR